MADYFVDSTTGDNGDNGTTMDLAWATLEYAMESGGLAAGDNVWVRRVHVEYSGAPTSDIVMAYYGSVAGGPIQIIGWPRPEIPAATITEGDWTNGSTTVDNIVGITCDREKHLGRFAVGPDGNRYLITKITDSNTIIIDREYVGSTVTGTDGAFSIEEDEDYDLAQAIDDSGWTIQKSDYNGDAIDLPCVDFQDEAYSIRTDSRNIIKNIEFRDSTDSTGGAVDFWLSEQSKFIGCLIHQSNNAPIIRNNNLNSLERCIVTGNGAAGSSNKGIVGDGTLISKNTAIYGFYYCIDYNSGRIELFNVNIGVEEVSAGNDIRFYNSMAAIFGVDIKTGSAGIGTLGTRGGFFQAENYGKDLGSHYFFHSLGDTTIIKTDVVEGSGDPEKRSSGADSVIEYTATSNHQYAGVSDLGYMRVFTHEFEVDTASKSYRYYVQAEDGIAADELWLEAEYVSAYDDDSEYIIATQKSDEAITVRSGADDWSQYIEVTGIAPAVASKVRIKCYCSYYHATNAIYIDPMVVIS